MIRLAHHLALTACLSIALAGSARAQTLVSRESTLNYNYVYGAGGDSHTGNNTVPDTTLLASDTEQTGDSGATSGTLPGDPPRPYSAGVSCDLEHEYAVAGPLTSFRSITATGSTLVTAASSGFGTAQMIAANPGNSLTLYFNLSAPIYYSLNGVITLDEAGFASGVALQRFDGIVWAQVFNSIFLPGGQGAFSSSGTLNPGQYRISSSIALDAFGNENKTGTYNYTLRTFIRADMNCDGKVDGLDIQAFADALLDPIAYAADYPTCNPLNGDFNNDNSVTTADVAPFTQCVLTGGCP